MKKIYLLLAAAALAAGLSSCVKDEVYGYPSINDIKNTIALKATDEVQVEAKITSLVGVESAALYWKAAEGTYAELPMTATEDIYSATIPAQALDVEVFYYIKATSKEGEVTTSKEISYVVGLPPVDYTGLVLNELNGNDKFIELYNGSNNDIFLRKVTILKDEEKNWDAPEVTLKKGEYMLLYSEDVAADHPDYDETLIFHSGLSAKKAVRVRLLDPKGNTIDDFNLVNHGTGKNVPGSYGRNKDGQWYIQETVTPKAANVDGTESVESWLTK